MSGNLFCPDLFSRSRPAFEPLEDDLFHEIVSVISTHYSHLGHSPESATKLSGLEINSRNFRVRLGPHFYALKRAGKQVCNTVCSAQIAISQNLLERGITFPRIIRNDSGEYYSLHTDGHIWILADFVDGDYFSGCREHFSVLADAIGKLQSSLESFSPVTLPRSIAAGSWPKTKKILSELFDRQTEWDTLFPVAEYGALMSAGEILADASQNVETQIAGFINPLVPTHIDLHPHNILINPGGHPVFVDIDSLQVAGRTQCLAFATYKLARQYVVYERLQGSPHEISRTTRQFVERLCQTANLDNETYLQFPLGATAEVLRRIALIADLNMHAGNREWNAVLHMQLNALHEIPLLFGEICELNGGQ